MKIREYMEGYLAYIGQKGLCNKTITEHKRLLFGPVIKAVGDIELPELKRCNLPMVECEAKIYGRFGPQRSLCVLRRLLSYVEDLGEQLPFPWRNIQLPKMPKTRIEALEPPELDMIRDAIDIEESLGFRLRVLIEVMVATGVRIGEAVALNKSDIDWEKKEALIKNIKTKEMQKIYFTDLSLSWIKKYLERRTDTCEALFVAFERRLDVATAKNHLRKYTRNLHLGKRIRFHIFRKTFVTNLLNNNVNIKNVQYLARHESERTTLKYYAAINIDKAKDEYTRAMDKLYTDNFDTLGITWQNDRVCLEREKQVEMRR